MIGPLVFTGIFALAIAPSRTVQLPGRRTGWRLVCFWEFDAGMEGYPWRGG